MADPTPTPDSAIHLPSSDDSSTESAKPVSPLKCFTGAAISGSIGTGAYFLTHSIAETFANKPLPTGSGTAIRIAVLVPTLVVSMSTLATMVFAIVGLGLLALGIQLLLQQGRSPKSDHTP